ncbi:MAG TPA: AMP-binding protein [Methylomirabilota bacterium]|nr:AMP-binding protein [Methylomirabilota bacterium]
MPEIEVPRDAMGSSLASPPDTFPKLLLDRAERYGDRPAIREKDLGIWQTWTWRQVRDEVQALASGLAAMGFRRGDRLAIVGDNRPRLYWAISAAQCLGGVPVPMYQDSVAAELRYVLEHAEARFAVAEDQEQVDKILEIRNSCPRLEAVIYDDPRGLRNYDQPFLHRYEDIQSLGRRRDREHPDAFSREVAAGAGHDVAIILYTSGTTGRPKGVMLTHENVIVTARNAVAFDRLGPDDEVLAYLPMAWVGDYLISVAQSYAAGFCMSCPESGATVLTDLREIGPTYFFAPPRIWENLLTTVMIRMEDAGAPKRAMFRYFMDVARGVGARLLDRQPVSLPDRLRYGLGQLLVYGPLRNTLGFSRIRVAYTAGESIGPEIFGFYRSLGINIKQLYGQTEASVFVTVQPDGQVRPDTVGVPAAGVEVRVTEAGEVMYRSPGVFQGYFKDPEATAETKTADGWVRTGDAGFFDQEGHLHIVDRAKDVGQLRGGGLFAPKYLENKLKFFPHIKEAVVFGADREYVTALVNIDLTAVGSWAERRNLPYGSYQDLATHEQVAELIRGCVEQVNRDLAGEARLAPSQIRRFLILHKELDADDGELTRTRKVRRRFISERYGPLVEALYGDDTHCTVESQVTFEDGRTGFLKADLRIHETATTPTPARR